MLQALKSRGLVAALTSPKLQTKLNAQKITLYAGVDPTAPSLHAGNLLPLMILLHFYIRGHSSIGLVGDATVQVGDPSGRVRERDRILEAQKEKNIAKMNAQIVRFFERGRDYALKRGHQEDSMGKYSVLSNKDWLGKLSMLDFIGNFGRHVRVGQMISRERLAAERGLSYAEFSYQLLQAYDFYHLYNVYDCTLQVGGSDQWGNITAGMDVIDRMREAKDSDEVSNEPRAYGLTTPLLVTKSGEKFGKSAGNAVWLDPEMTTPYDFFQFFARAHDEQMEAYLKLFTLLPLDVIDKIVSSFRADPSARVAHYTLAEEVTTLVHGEEAAKKAKIATQILHGSDELLDVSSVLDVFCNDSRLIKAPRELVAGQLLAKVARELGISKNRSEIEQVIRAGGCYVGFPGRRVSNVMAVIEDDWILRDRLLVIRFGKFNYNLIEISPRGSVS